MKEYMLIYKGGDPDWMKNTSQEEMAEKMNLWRIWMEKLEQSKQLVSGGSPLHFAGKRINKQSVVTDIAASEFKELVSGYSIVAATDIDEAVAIANECPIFHTPDITVEVREVVQMS